MGPVQHQKLIRLLSLLVALDLAAGVVALYARGGAASAAAPGARTSRAAEADAGSNGILAGGHFRDRRGPESSTGAAVPGKGEAPTASTSTSAPRVSTSTTGQPAPATTGRPPTSSSSGSPATSSTTPPSSGPRPTSSGGGTHGSSTTTSGASSSTTPAVSDGGSVVVDDPAGDTVIDGTSESKGEGRADVVRSRAINRGGEVELSVQVRQPVDPAEDSSWEGESTFVAWEVDTSGDGAPDYEVQFFLLDGSYTGTVGRAGDAAAEALCDAVGSYGPDGYTAMFESSCLGDPASFSYRASIYYDTNPNDENADVLFDVTPNGGLSRPVKRS